MIVIFDSSVRIAFSCGNTEIEEMKKVGVSEGIIKYYCELYYSKKPKDKLQKFEIKQEVDEEVNDDMILTKKRMSLKKSIVMMKKYWN